MAASDIILSYIERKGWQAQRAGEGWHARQPGQEADLFLSFTPSWICLQAPLVGGIETGPTGESYRRLLSGNETMFNFMCSGLLPTKLLRNGCAKRITLGHPSM